MLRLSEISYCSPASTRSTRVRCCASSPEISARPLRTSSTKNRRRILFCNRTQRFSASRTTLCAQIAVRSFFLIAHNVKLRAVILHLMIAHLRGTLLEKHPNAVILDVQGVGYEVVIPVSAYSSLPEKGAAAQLHIYTHVREDAIT